MGHRSRRFAGNLIFNGDLENLGADRVQRATRTPLERTFRFSGPITPGFTGPTTPFKKSSELNIPLRRAEFNDNLERGFWLDVTTARTFGRIGSSTNLQIFTIANIFCPGKCGQHARSPSHNFGFFGQDESASEGDKAPIWNGLPGGRRWEIHRPARRKNTLCSRIFHASAIFCGRLDRPPSERGIVRPKPEQLCAPPRLVPGSAPETWFAPGYVFIRPTTAARTTDPPTLPIRRPIATKSGFPRLSSSPFFCSRNWISLQGPLMNRYRSPCFAPPVSASSSITDSQNSALPRCRSWI